MKFMPNTLFGRLFVAITLVMMLTVFVIRFISISVIAIPGGEKLGTLSISLLKVVEYVNIHMDAQSYLALTEELQETTGVVIVNNIDERGDTLPDLPFLKSWQQRIDRYQAGNILRYQSAPKAMVWLLHSNKPQFSVGIPMVDLYNNRNFLYLIFGFALFISAIPAYFLARYLMAPLNDLVVAANAMARNIKSVEINPSGPKEIQALGLAMQTMRAELLNITKEQEFLLAGVSHDLRTPLTRIRITSELMFSEDDEMVEAINSDIEEIDNVLQRFIELARINIEESELWTLGDINPLVKDVAEKYGRAKTKLSISLCKSSMVFYKPSVLKRFLYNAIDNSIKYGNGVISIGTVKNANMIDLYITDQGLGFGLSNEQLQAFSDLTREQGVGSGLGLRIIQRIAKMHDAKLTLRDHPKGGAEIILSLKVYST
jgi:two-component system osmolarity sensor histidine kinase EnvZ